jgi:hypothetical protein
MKEPLPLATIHDAVLEFLRDRDDAVLCGAHAVNAYVSRSRMTQDVDLLSPRGFGLCTELGEFLSARFHMKLCVYEVRDGCRYRIYQVREFSNQHLIDVWFVGQLPPSQRVAEVLVLTPPELIVHKVTSMVRRLSPHRDTDKADIYRLLLTFPELKMEEGLVAARLRATGADAAVFAVWKELVAPEFLPDDEDSGY